MDSTSKIVRTYMNLQFSTKTFSEKSILQFQHTMYVRNEISETVVVQCVKIH